MARAVRGGSRLGRNAPTPSQGGRVRYTSPQPSRVNQGGAPTRTLSPSPPRTIKSKNVRPKFDSVKALKSIARNPYLGAVSPLGLLGQLDENFKPEAPTTKMLRGAEAALGASGAGFGLQALKSLGKAATKQAAATSATRSLRGQVPGIKPKGGTKVKDTATPLSSRALKRWIKSGDPIVMGNEMARTAALKQAGKYAAKGATSNVGSIAAGQAASRSALPGSTRGVAGRTGVAGRSEVARVPARVSTRSRVAKQATARAGAPAAYRAVSTIGAAGGAKRVAGGRVAKANSPAEYMGQLEREHRDAVAKQEARDAGETYTPFFDTPVQIYTRDENQIVSGRTTPTPTLEDIDRSEDVVVSQLTAQRDRSPDPNSIAGYNERIAQAEEYYDNIRRRLQVQATPVESAATLDEEIRRLEDELARIRARRPRSEEELMRRRAANAEGRGRFALTSVTNR